MRKPARLARVHLALAAALLPAQAPVDVHPVVATQAVSKDPDDPAIWVHPSQPGRSVIIATNKAAAPWGALVVYDLNGKARQTLAGINRPNNVDVEYGLRLGGATVDIAVATERYAQQLRVYRIQQDGRLALLGTVSVFTGQKLDAAAPMGIALYRRPRDGAIYAIVSRKIGPKSGYLWQYRLEGDGRGRIRGVKVREFGNFSGKAEIEAVAVDDELGYVYYADENDGIRKWHADPDHPEAAKELAYFGRTGFLANQEGIAIYARGQGTGYIICTDQIPGGSRFLLFRREGTPGNPHDHSEVVKVVRSNADSTDGIEATSAPLGAKFPHGLLVAMNGAGRNFLLYRWEDIAAAGQPKLLLGRE